MSESDYCEFCEIHARSKALDSAKREMTEILCEDNEFFSFHDLNKATAVQHVLVCTHEHIETALHVKQVDKLIRMKNFAIKTLDKLLEDQKIIRNETNTYRFGFHLPPHNSVFHIHMHCFVEPFAKDYYGKIAYGMMLKSVQEVIAIKEREDLMLAKL